MLSDHFIGFRHCGHLEPGFIIDIHNLGRRNIQTLRKLPMIKPKGIDARRRINL
jgi:hypothetical protein